MSEPPYSRDETIAELDAEKIETVNKVLDLMAALREARRPRETHSSDPVESEVGR